MIRVLLVEDDPFWQNRLRHDLGEMPDIEVTAVLSDKESAIDFLRQERNDVVLMDIHLTGNNLDGLEATRIIDRMTKGSTKIVMLTSFEESAVIIDSFRQGAINYIPKSSYAGVVAAIREAYAGKASLQAEVADAVRAELQLSVLTPMEREVYELKNKGLNKNQIAERLIKSVNTIKSHLKNIRDKLK